MKLPPSVTLRRRRPSPKGWLFPRPRRDRPRCERLESRLALAVASVEWTSGDDFLIDPSEGMTCNYVSIKVTNDAVADPDLWVTVGDFTGGVIGNAPGADGIYHLGPLAANASAVPAFYMQALVDTDVDQTFTVRVYESDPRVGSPPAVSTSTFTFVDVIDTEQNSRMKIDSVSYSTDAPVLGGELLVSVVGELGEMNATRDAYFTPACLPTWPSDIFEFAGTEIAITGGPNARVDRDGLLLTGFTNASLNPFRTDSTFRITNVTTTETFISPTQWSGKKQNYSHHSLTEYPVPPIQPVDNVTTLAKSAAPGLLPAAGGTVTYTLTLTNIDETQTVWVNKLIDRLPALPGASTYVAGSSSFNGAPIGDPAIVAGEMTWSGRYAVPAGGTSTLSYRAVLPGVSGVYLNRAIGRIGEVQIDTTLDIDDDAPAVAPVIVGPTADLAIEKRDFTQVYVPGAPLRWQITVTNPGPDAVTGARVRDAFPGQVDPASISWSAVFTGGGGATSGTGDIDELINLLPGGSAVYTVDVETFSTASGPLSNTATVTPPANVTDPNLTNNTWTDVDQETRVADLSVTKLDAGPTYVPGLATTYTVTVTGARVVDTFASAFSGISWTALFTGDGSSGNASGSGSINEVVNLAAGGTATYTVTATVASTATAAIENVASVAAPDGTTDPDLSNNSARDVNTATPRVDLTITKTDGTGTYVPGRTLTYTITVTNAGPSFLTGGTLTDLFPAAIVAPTWSATYTDSGSGGPGSGAGDIAATFDLAVGGTAIFTVTAPVRSSATGNLVNTASIAVPPNTTNINPVTSATDTDTPAPLADLRVLKTAAGTSYVPGGTTVYTITVSNFGPSGATNARVQDAFPADIAAATWTAVFSGGSGRGSGTGSIDELVSLDVYGTAVYTVTATIRATASDLLSNTATVAAPAGTTDPNLANNTATAVQTPTAVAGGVVVSPDDGCPDQPFVQVRDPVSGALKVSFLAYEPRFRGGVRVATGDLDGDGFDEIVTAPGRGRQGLIRVWTQEGVELVSYRTLPFGSRYTGGVDVALGDVDGDGRSDLITSMTSGAGTVRVFLVGAPTDSDPVANGAFRSFTPAFGRYRGGTVVAAADFGRSVDGVWQPLPDGISEVVVGTNAGVTATVRIYDIVRPLPRVVATMQPFGRSFRGGVTLAIGRYDEGPIPDILVGAGIGGRSVVSVQSGSTFSELVKLQAFSGFAKPNARVFTAPLDADGDGLIDRIYATQGQGGGGGTRGVTFWRRLGGTIDVLPDTEGLRPPLRVRMLGRLAPNALTVATATLGHPVRRGR